MSDYLFAQPSALLGLGMMLDFAGAIPQYNRQRTGREADALAISLDWTVVASDLRAAFEQFKIEHPEVVVAAER
jgi:hypothetical protein